MRVALPVKVRVFPPPVKVILLPVTVRLLLVVPPEREKPSALAEAVVLVVPEPVSITKVPAASGKLMARALVAVEDRVVAFAPVPIAREEAAVVIETVVKLPVAKVPLPEESMRVVPESRRFPEVMFILVPLSEISESPIV